jgi:hypothetical protein
MWVDIFIHCMDTWTSYFCIDSSYIHFFTYRIMCSYMQINLYALICMHLFLIKKDRLFYREDTRGGINFDTITQNHAYIEIQ